MGSNKFRNFLFGTLIVGIVGMTVAFASLTQQLNITNNQVSVSSKWRVRFTVRNEGNIAAKGELIAINLGNLTCENGANSSISQASLDTFCSKLTKWVRHSDRVTDWSAADTLAAYSGSGDNYPHIDGILRIEYPSTLSNSDIAAISGGSIVVTLGDTTLNFEQDDNVTAQSGGNNQTGGGNEQGGNNQSGGNQEEQSGNYVYKLWGDWSEDLTSVTHIYNKVHDFYLRKNTDTNKIEACAELSGGLGCVDNHAFDCTLTYNNQDSKWECNDTSSYVYQKQIELENKGATCEFYNSSFSYMSCFDNSNGSERGCLLSTNGNDCANPMLGQCIMTDPDSDSYCTDS